MTSRLLSSTMSQLTRTAMGSKRTRIGSSLLAAASSRPLAAAAAADAAAASASALFASTAPNGGQTWAEAGRAAASGRTPTPPTPTLTPTPARSLSSAAAALSPNSGLTWKQAGASARGRALSSASPNAAGLTWAEAGVVAWKFCPPEVDFSAAAPSTAAAKHMDLEGRYGAENYHPLPVVWSRASGVHVWDVDNNRLIDFLSAYSAVNQGHCHPAIVGAATAQMQQLCISSRAFYSDKADPHRSSLQLGEFQELCSDIFGYERMLPMNTGAEAVETALKLCRRWGYDVKGIAPNAAKILWAKGNFHGRTLSIVSASSDPDARNGYGPFMPGFELVDYGDALQIEEKLAADPSIAGVLLEPLQGEAGVIVPPDGYLSRVREACTAHNALFMADEIQSGLGRTGTMLAVEHDGVRPDVLILAKALSGGVFPVSAVLCDSDIMSVIRPGQHGSTYGGNPVAAAVGTAALNVLLDENLCENSAAAGINFRSGVESMASPLVKLVRGRGLMNAVVINQREDVDAWQVCLKLAENGILAKPTHNTTIRFTPPLTISGAQMDESLEKIERSLKALE